ncbi:unnamed protein product [Nezara viridula]|uniref:Uncharacterized protein n=1 Tax=Nezara viridula TaxID=85310 RepID=A0A9P0MQL0_NEZVI|nr:unnamed protein product [Nezara viridula]
MEQAIDSYASAENSDTPSGAGELEVDRRIPLGVDPGAESLLGRQQPERGGSGHGPYIAPVRRAPRIPLQVGPPRHSALLLNTLNTYL